MQNPPVSFFFISYFIAIIICVYDGIKYSEMFVVSRWKYSWMLFVSILPILNHIIALAFLIVKCLPIAKVIDDFMSKPVYTAEEIKEMRKVK